jgi:hypothetical protein
MRKSTVRHDPTWTAEPYEIAFSTFRIRASSKPQIKKIDDSWTRTTLHMNDSDDVPLLTPFDLLSNKLGLLLTLFDKARIEKFIENSPNYYATLVEGSKFYSEDNDPDQILPEIGPFPRGFDRANYIYLFNEIKRISKELQTHGLPLGRKLRGQEEIGGKPKLSAEIANARLRKDLMARSARDYAKTIRLIKYLFRETKEDKIETLFIPNNWSADVIELADILAKDFEQTKRINPLDYIYYDLHTTPTPEQFKKIWPGIAKEIKEIAS